MEEHDIVCSTQCVHLCVHVCVCVVGVRVVRRLHGAVSGVVMVTGVLTA